MVYENRYDGIDEYIVKTIKAKAIKLVGSFGFTDSDRRDLQQEMILDLLRRLPKYNPERAQFTTFIARVVNNKVATIIEAQKAGMRDYRLCYCSLNDRLEYDEHGWVERMEIIDQDDYFQGTGRRSRPVNELHDLSIDVERIMEKLPHDLSDLCERFKAGDTITEISHETGIPRGTLYDRLKRINAIFENKGLREYL